MTSKTVNTVVLALISLTLWIVDTNYTVPYITKILYTSLALTGTYLLFTVAEKLIITRIRDYKAKYSIRKALSTIALVVSAAVILTVWVRNPQALLVSYGVLAAIAGIGLQDFVKNFTGGITLFAVNQFKIGDRIAIGEVVGDVVDIGILYTTVMEIRGWIKGDQATGRLVTIPNAKLTSDFLINYTKDNSFIWDEITIPVTYDSDWRKAREIMMNAAESETKDFIEPADRELKRIKQKYYLTEKNTAPSANITLTDNWVELTVRYITDVRERRAVSNRIGETVLNQFEKAKRITIASETVDVTLRK